MSTPPVIAFVDGKRVEVPAGGTVLDAVRALDPNVADAVERGTRGIADSRGLPIASDAPVGGGTILRLVAPRRREADPASDP